MTDFKAIKGFSVKSLAADPLPGGGVVGGTWSSGGAMNTARAYMGGAGSQTAGIVYGGENPSVTANTEKYDGSSWTEVNNLNTARSYMAGGGTQTAAIASGGYIAPNDSNLVEVYNGTNWTEVSEINTGRSLYCAQAGTSTANLIFGGYDETSPNVVVLTELWDGSSWTEVADLNTARYNGGGSGSSTAALISGGNPGGIADVESWDGSSWTEVANLNTARGNAGSGVANTSNLAVGGSNTGIVANTESWNGTAWTEIADLAAANTGGSGNSGSTSSATLSFGGTPGYRTQTEEFTAGGIGDTIKNEGQVYYNSTDGTMNITAVVFGTGAWSSGGTMNTANAGGQSLGGRDDNISCGPQGQVSTEKYNGTAWTALSSPSNMGEGRGEAGSAGTSTLGLVFGGYEPGTTAITELWDGSTWTEVNNLSSARNEIAGFGFGDSIFCAAGSSPRILVEEWNGTSWSEKAEINTGRGNLGSAGTGADGLIFGGRTGTTFYAVTEAWNGTSWTETGDLGTARNYGAAGGATSASSMYAGGNTPGQTANTETFNGTSWTEVANLSAAKTSGKGAPNGSATSMINAGGSPANTATEEWNVPSATTNLVMSD